MRIVLMRHGHSERAGMDPSLSAEGRVAASAAARELARTGGAQRIAHSPLRRAVETTSLVIEACGDVARVESKLLLPNAAPDRAGFQLMQWGADVDTLLVVAHLPLLPGLSRWLCDRLLPFEPADTWCLEADTASAWRGTFAVVDERP